MTEELRLECLKLACEHSASGREVDVAYRFLQFVQYGDANQGAKVLGSVGNAQGVAGHVDISALSQARNNAGY